MRPPTTGKQAVLDALRGAPGGLSTIQLQQVHFRAQARINELQVDGWPIVRQPDPAPDGTALYILTGPKLAPKGHRGGWDIRIQPDGSVSVTSINQSKSQQPHGLQGMADKILGLVQGCLGNPQETVVDWLRDIQD